MVDDDGGDQQNGVTEARTFFVRLGESDDSPFALCDKIGTAEGSDPVPGTGKTVAQLVAEQALLAAAAPRGSPRVIPELIDDGATGANLPDGNGPGGN